MAAAPNTQRAKATGPPQMGWHGRLWLSHEARGGLMSAGTDHPRYKGIDLAKGSGKRMEGFKRI